MSIRRNPLYSPAGYNDPAIGQAAGALASMFAPPSPQEIMAGAKAQELSARLPVLRQFYGMAADPNTTRDQIDRFGVVTGTFAPNQSFYGVDAGNRRALEETWIKDAGDTARKMLDPVAEGATRFVPPTLADQFKVEPVQVGTINAGRGDTVVTPDGRTIMGAPIPLTDEQVKGAILQGMDRPTQQNFVLAGQGVEPVVGPDGRTTFAGRADAVGQAPGARPNERPLPDTKNYSTPDGRRGTARSDAGGVLRDTQTGEAVPAGSTVFGTQVQGDMSQTGLSTGTRSVIDKQLLSIASAENTLLRYRDMVAKNPAVQGLTGQIQGTLQNLLQTGGEVAQLVGSSREDLMRSVESGRFAPDAVARFSNFRTDIPAAEALRQMLIAQIAEATTNDPQVSNKDIERVEKQVGGGSLLSNQADTLARLDQVLTDLRARRGTLAQANTAGSRTFPGATAGAAPPPGPANTAAPTVINTPAGAVTIQRIGP